MTTKPAGHRAAFEEECCELWLPGIDLRLLIGNKFNQSIEPILWALAQDARKRGALVFDSLLSCRFSAEAQSRSVTILADAFVEDTAQIKK